jgi:hypothetical protein
VSPQGQPLPNKKILGAHLPQVARSLYEVFNV